MKPRLQLGLPAALALASGLAYLQHFAESARSTSLPKSARQAVAPLATDETGTPPDSLLALAVKADTLPPRSPFALARPPRPVHENPAAVQPIQRPPLYLKGTVGDQVATLMDPSGKKSIVRKGQYIDSVEIVRIAPGRVTLRDRHGTFDITAKE